MLSKLVTVSQKLSPDLRKAIGNISWLFADRILRMGVALFVGVWLARYLGPDQFGLYNYAIAFVTLLSVFATLGLDRIVVRDLVREPSAQEEILGTTFVVKLIGGFMTFGLTLALVFLLRQDNLSRWLIGVTAAGTIFQAFDTIDFWFQSQVQSKYTVWAKNAAYLLLNLIKILLIQVQAPLIAFAWAGLAELIVAAIGLVIVYRLKGHSFTAWQSSIQRAKKLLKDSLPLVPAGLAVMIYLRSDSIMLGEMVGTESVGIYSVATRISEIWYFIPLQIVSSLSPYIIEAKAVSETLYYQRIQNLFNLVAGLAYAVAIPMTFFSEKIIVLLYGKQYAVAGTVLSIHIWASLFVFLGVAKGTWIVTEGLTKSTIITTLTGATANVLLNLLLIPIWRETGSAIATVISYALADYLLFLIYPPFRKIGHLMTKALTFNFIYTRMKRS